MFAAKIVDQKGKIILVTLMLAVLNFINSIGVCQVL